MDKKSIRSLTLYYYYAQEDRALLEELEKHLKAVKLQAQLITWHEGEIQAGTDWQKHRVYHLQTADIILVLLSPDFFTSKATYQEDLEHALVRHGRKEVLLIPILLRPVDLGGMPMNTLKALPSNGVHVTMWQNRDEAFMNIAQGIRQAITTLMESESIRLSNSSSNMLIDKDAYMPINEPNTQEGIYKVVQSTFLFNIPLTDPNEFYGRRIERLKLLDRIYKRSATSIVGPRRIGKTWLMQYTKLVAPVQFGSRFRIAYIDATAPGCATIAGFVAVALEKLGIHNEQLADVKLNLVYLEHVIKDMVKHGIMPVLCIDEFEGLMNEDIFDLRFFSGLRAIAQEGLVFVAASKHSLRDLVSSALTSSPFFNIFEKLTLKPFASKDAETFVHEKSDLAGFNDQERKRILRYGQIDESSWPPARLQLAGTLLLEEKTLAQEDADYYRPDDPGYWDDFEQRLEEKYEEIR